MNYFEFVDPYYALIKAKNDEEAVKKYIEVVAGDEGEFESLVEECKSVPEYYAAAKLSRSNDEFGKLVDFEEVRKLLESGDTEILLIDGSLI